MSTIGARWALTLLATALLACGGGGEAGTTAEATPTTATPSTVSSPATDDLWCTRYERFDRAASAVTLDASAPDARARIAAALDGGGEAADDLAAAAEEAEILLLDTAVPTAIAEPLARLLGRGAGVLDASALGAVADHVTGRCGLRGDHVALLARLGGA